MSRVNHHADTVGIPSLAVALYLAARAYRGGLKALAIDMEMDYDLLQAKLNPSKAQYLTPEELERFLTLAGNNDIHLAISKAGGGIAYTPLPMANAADMYRALSVLSQKRSEFEAFMAEALERGGPLAPDSDSYLRLEKLLLESAQVMLGILHGVRTSATAGGEEPAQG